MSKQIKRWWVVASREDKTITKEECDALGMVDFCDLCIATRVFTSKRQADTWIKQRKRLNGIPDEIDLQVVSDEAWVLILEMFIKGKSNK